MEIAQFQQFSFEGCNIRTTVDISGNPWFLAGDVCKVLAIANSRHALTRLDPDEKGVATADTLGGQQEQAIIDESGLYSLILTSRKPEAKRFRKWVTSGVLPSIRKTGSFTKQKNTMLPTTYIQALEHLIDTEKQKEAALLALGMAVATKAEIGSRREATSMATASSAVRERNKILKELGRAQTTATIRAVNKATGGDYQFRLLRDWCNFTEVQIDRVPDPLYGEVNTYPAAAWRAVYGIDLAKVFAESNFAPRELNDSTEVGS
jgi:prophage antirepressor-like protein